MRWTGLRISSFRPETSTNASNAPSISSIFRRIIDNKSSSRCNDVSILHDTNSNSSINDLSTSESVSCPVCGECMNASSINCHIDECLARTSESDGDSRATDVNQPADVSEGSCFSTACERVSSSNAEHIDSQSFVCPVCGLPQLALTGDVRRINQHIDECLNRDMLQDSRSSGSLDGGIR